MPRKSSHVVDFQNSCDTCTKEIKIAVGGQTPEAQTAIENLFPKEMEDLDSGELTVLLQDVRGRFALQCIGCNNVDNSNGGNDGSVKRCTKQIRRRFQDEGIPITWERGEH